MLCGVGGYFLAIGRSLYTPLEELGRVWQRRVCHIHYVSYEQPIERLTSVDP
jgi:hypothetical protein